MQKIERYGVIALVFLLVTILAVSLWGEGKDGGLLPWKKDATKADAQAAAERPRPRANGGLGAARGPLAGAQRNDVAQRPVGAGLELTAPNPQANAPVSGFVSTAPDATPLPNPNADLARATPPVQAPQPLAGRPLTTPSSDVAVPVGAGTLVRGAPAQQQPPTLPVVAPSNTVARTYVVKSGDTLGAIASRELGSSARWTEIQALNGGLDPKRMREGMTLRLPSGGAVATNKPAASTVSNVAKNTTTAAGSYTIRSGDTLSAIASRELGEADRWREIVALNPRLDPARLSVGAVIALPSGRSAGTNVATAPRAEERQQIVAYGPAPKSKSGVQ